jgi:hypothetical protein
MCSRPYELVRCPARSPPPIAALPSMSLFPKAPFDLSVCPSMSHAARWAPFASGRRARKAIQSSPSCFRIACASVFLILLCRGTGTTRAPVHRIDVKIVIRAVAFQVATTFSKTSHELMRSSPHSLPLPSRLCRLCRSPRSLHSRASQRDRHFMSFSGDKRALCGIAND